MTVRIDEDNDPVADWQKHNNKLRRYCDILNEHNFENFILKVQMEQIYM